MSLDPALRHKGLMQRWWTQLQTHFEQQRSGPQAYVWARSRWWARWLVRRRTLRLFGWMGGFVHSQVLLACVQLRLFERLPERDGQTLETLAGSLAVPAARLQPLLASACAMELLALDPQGRYALGPLGRVVRSHPGIAQMVEHNQLLYRDMVEPVAFLRQSDAGLLAAYWPYAQDAGAGPALVEGARAQLQRYSVLMDATQGFVITEVLDHYRFADHHTVLDLGCGQGRFLSAVAQAHPHLQLQLFDLPAVLELTRQRLAEAGLSARAQWHPGSFLDDALPSGADLVTLIRVAHDHSDAALRVLFAKVRALLPVGGRLLLAEPMQLPDAQAAIVDPYFHFYLQAMGLGRLRSPQQLMQLLRDSGFDTVECVKTAMPVHAQLLVAQKTSVNPSIINKKSI